MPIAQIQDNDRRERFVATAGQTVFPYDFPIYAATDLQVRRERSGVITTLTYGADYSVTGAQNQTGGNVVLTAGATLNDIIVILSNMSAARTGQFVNGGDLSAAALEAEFNRNRILIQQNYRDGRNALLFPPTDPSMQDLPPIALRASRFLAFDINGQPYAATPAAGTVLDAISRLGDNMSGRFGFTPGSATAPGLTPNNDNTSGLFSQPGAIAVAVNGQEVSRFISGGLRAEQTGTGSVSRTVESKLRDTIHVKDFGAVGDGITDDGPAIQAAINAAIARQGGSVNFGGLTYKITSSLNVTGLFGVNLIGQGSDGSHDGGAGFGPATKILWAGAPGGTMLNFASNIGASRMYGGGVLDMQLDCQAVAGIGLLVNSIRNGNFSRIYVSNPTIAAYKLTTRGNAAMAEASDTQRCVFDRLSWRCIDSAAVRGAHGIWITSYSPVGADSNTSLNWFLEPDGQNWGGVGSGYGIFLEDGDNNTFINPRIYRVNTTVEAIRINGNTSCDANHFWNPSTGGSSGTNGIGIKGTASGFAINPTRNSFWCVDQGNGTLYPTADAGVIFGWHGDNNVWVKKLGKQMILGDNDAPILFAAASFGTETLKVINASGNHMILTNGTEIWGVNINTANGDLRLQRVAGTGSVDVGNGAPVKIEGKTVLQGAVDTGGAGFRLLRVAN